MKSCHSFTFGKFRIQFVWPDIYFRKRKPLWEGDSFSKDFFIGFQTAIRVTRQTDYWAAGFSILGFGVGFDWLDEKEK